MPERPAGATEGAALRAPAAPEAVVEVGAGIERLVEGGVTAETPALPFEAEASAAFAGQTEHSTESGRGAGVGAAEVDPESQDSPPTAMATEAAGAHVGLQAAPGKPSLRGFVARATEPSAKDGTVTSMSASMSVFCVCRGGPRLQCGGMYYSLLQCGPACPSACRQEGQRFNSCIGNRELMWMKRLNQHFVECAGSP